MKYAAVVFDLDGTLWDVKPSYFYAYNRVCEKYALKKVKSLAEVAKMPGKSLEVVFASIFADELSEEQKAAVLQDCIAYSCEYLLQHPESVYADTASTLCSLAREYPLFLISGCPEAYIRTFLSVSGLDGVFQDTFALSFTDRTKPDVLSSVKAKYPASPVLFVGDSAEESSFAARIEGMDFCYASYGYGDCDRFDGFLHNISDLADVLRRYDYKTSVLSDTPFETVRCLDAELTLMDKGQGVYYFGFLHLSADRSVNEQLLDLSERRLTELKAKTVYGPIDRSTWYSYRFAIENFEFKLYPDIHNSAEDVKLFLDKGYTYASLYSSTLAKINERLWRRAKSVHTPYRVEYAAGKAVYDHLSQLYDVAVDAFVDAEYYEPISYEDFCNIYVQNLTFLENPYLVLVYDGAELIAFDFCYEGPEKRFFVSKTIAIKKAYRSKGVIFLFLDKSFELVKEKGYEEVLYHYQNESKGMALSIWKNLEIKHKKYALLKKEYR